MFLHAILSQHNKQYSDTEWNTDAFTIVLLCGEVQCFSRLSSVLASGRRYKQPKQQAQKQPFGHAFIHI